MTPSLLRLPLLLSVLTLLVGNAPLLMADTPSSSSAVSSSAGSSYASSSSSVALVPASSVCLSSETWSDLTLSVAGLNYWFNPCQAVTTSVCNHPGAVQFCQQYTPPLSFSWTPAYYYTNNPTTTWYLNPQGQLTSQVSNGDGCTQLSPNQPRSVQVTYLCDANANAPRLTSVLDAVTGLAPTNSTCAFLLQVTTRAGCTAASSICPALPSPSADSSWTASNGMVYWYNPCRAVTSSVCNHPGAVQFCQQYSPPSSNSWTPAYYQTNNAGMQWYLNTQGALVSYEANGDNCGSSSTPRSVVVTYVCDLSVQSSRLLSVTDADASRWSTANITTCRFNLTVSTQAVCPASSSSSAAVSSSAVSSSAYSSSAVSSSAVSSSAVSSSAVSSSAFSSSARSSSAVFSSSSSVALVPASSVCLSSETWSDLTLSVAGLNYWFNPCQAVTTSVCNHPGAVQFCQQYTPPLSFSWTPAYYYTNNPTTTWYLNPQGQLTSQVSNGDGCTQLSPNQPRSVQVTYLCDANANAPRLTSVLDAVTGLAPTNSTCAFLLQVTTRAGCTAASSICPALPSPSADSSWTASNGMVYWYNPCRAVTSSVCNHPGAVQFCQQYSPPSSNSWTPAYYQTNNAGMQWYLNTQGALVSYEANGDNCGSSSTPRSVVVTYVCDLSVQSSRLLSVTDADASRWSTANITTCRFNLTVSTQAVCPASSSSSAAVSSSAVSSSAYSSSAVSSSAVSSSAVSSSAVSSSAFSSSARSSSAVFSSSSSVALVPASSVCLSSETWSDLTLSVAGLNYWFNPCQAVTTSVCNHPGAVQFCQQYTPPLSFSWTPAYYYTNNPTTTWYLNPQGQLTSQVSNGDGCTQLSPNQPRSVQVTYLCDANANAPRLTSVLDAVTGLAPTNSTCAFLLQVTTRAGCTAASSICPALPSPSADSSWTASNGMVYWYNPCRAVTSSVCNHPGAVQFCQQYSPPSSNSWTPAYYQTNNAGMQWYLNTQGALVSYEANGDNCGSSSTPRSVVVTYVCDLSVQSSRLLSVTDADASRWSTANITTCRFNLTVSTQAVCPASSSSSAAVSSSAVSSSAYSSSAVSSSAVSSSAVSSSAVSSSAFSSSARSSSAVFSSSSSVALVPASSVCLSSETWSDLTLSVAGLNYWFNPCQAVTTSVCNHPGAVQFCQQYTPPLSFSWTPAYYYTNNPTTTWYLNPQGQLTSQVSNGDGCTQLSPTVPRSVVVTYLCDLSSYTAQLISVLDASSLLPPTNNTCHFALQVITRQRCSISFPPGSEQVSFALSVTAGFSFSSTAALATQLQSDIAANLATLLRVAQELLLPYISIISVNGVQLTPLIVDSSRRRLLQASSQQLPVSFVLSSKVSTVTSTSASTAINAFSTAASQGQLNTSIAGAQIPAQNVTSSSDLAPSSDSSSSSSSLGEGTIAGIAIGAVAGLAVCAALLYLVLRARKREDVKQRYAGQKRYEGEGAGATGMPQDLGVALATYPAQRAAVAPVYAEGQTLDVQGAAPPYSEQPEGYGEAPLPEGYGEVPMPLAVVYAEQAPSSKNPQPWTGERETQA